MSLIIFSLIIYFSIESWKEQESILFLTVTAASLTYVSLYTYKPAQSESAGGFSANIAHTETTDSRPAP